MSWSDFRKISPKEIELNELTSDTMTSEINLATKIASGSNSPKSKSHTLSPCSPALQKRSTVIEKESVVVNEDDSQSHSHEETDHLTAVTSHNMIIHHSPISPSNHHTPESHHGQYPDTKLEKLTIDHSHTQPSAETAAKFKEWQELQKQNEVQNSNNELI